jgi:tetratricopeptide (TPR) repeat protein
MKQALVWSLLLLTVACSHSQKPSVKNGEAIAEVVALNKKGIESMNRGAIDSALMLFNRAIAEDSNYYQSYSNKASVYMLLRQYEMALHQSEITNRKNPENAEGWSTTGMLSDKLNDSAKAVRSYQKSIEMLDKSLSGQKDKERISQIKLRKVLVYILMEDEKMATETLNQVLADNPNNSMIKNFAGIKKKTFMEQMLP